MASVSPGTEISLASIADPHMTIQGVLVSIDGRCADVSLEQATAEQATALHQGSLVQFQTAQTLYLGEIEAGWTEEGLHRLLILIEHSVDLQRAGAIRRLWNTDSPV